MLGADDRIVLADGVHVHAGVVVDRVRGASAPVNGTGQFVLERIDRSLGEIGAELASRYQIELERAADDVLAFAWQLNRGLFANVRTDGGRLARARARLSLTLRLLPVGRLPTWRSRRGRLDTTTVPRAIATAVTAAARRGLAVGVAATLLLLDASLAAGAGLVAPGAVGLAVGVGLVVHECGHAVALRGIPAALVSAGPRTYVLHAPLPPNRSAAVAAAGPFAAAAVGVWLVAFAAIVGVGWLALAGLPVAAHAIGLTVATHEGRKACGI